MAELIAKKDKSEKEEEEAERLVRKSPKKKPPRKDKERGRMEVEDPDTDKEDEDLSMNYKDIGGSVLLARHVASAYMAKNASMSEEEFLKQEVSNPEGTGTVKLKSLKNKSKHTKGFKVYEQERAKWQESQNKQEEEESNGKSKKKPEPQKSKSPKKEEESQKKPQKTDKSKGKSKSDGEISEERVEQIKEMDSDGLYDAATSGNEAEQAAAMEEIRKRKSPLPTDEDFPDPSEFRGSLDAKQVGMLKEQIKNWDLMDYNQNMVAIRENMMEAELSGNDQAKDFFTEVMLTYEEASDDALRHQNLREVSGPEDLVDDVEGLEEKYEGGNDPQLSKKRQQWYQTSMFSPLNDVDKLLQQVNEKIESKGKGGKADDGEVILDNDGNEIGSLPSDDSGDSWEDTKEAAYLEEMKNILTEVRDKKMFDKNTTGDKFLRSVRDEGDNEELKDLDPGSYDFTDVDDINSFVFQVRGLSGDALAEMTKDMPYYQMQLGISEGDAAGGDLSISDKRREDFAKALEGDLQARGFYEQLRFHNDEKDDNVYDRGSLLKYREDLMKDLKEQGLDFSDTSKLDKKVKDEKRFRGFWGTFLDWMDDAIEKANEKVSTMNSGEAISRGVKKAFAREGLRTSGKTSQYRGEPGPLNDADPHKPANTDWRLPIHMQLDDYIEIVRVAKEWLQDSYFQHVLVEWDQDMACRLALDYSIYTVSNYKYNGSVGAPTYDRLLSILKRLEA